jgi:crotonobetainyl-CoA:carnitine CoA-transferase CaiB-like acyl-CoA transferase
MVHRAEDVMDDEHVRRHNMIVSMDRPDGVDEPVLAVGNPVKLSRMEEGVDARIPWVGEHTDDVLREELGLDDDELARLRAAGAIS